MTNRRATVQKIDQVVAELLSQRGYAQALVNEEIQNVWNELVGTALAGISRPGKIRKGVLDIFVANSTANQELTFRRRELAKKLAEALPQYSISDLRVRVS
jgi:predicted nucleic acid-binding Zn ribbon protein